MKHLKVVADPAANSAAVGEILRRNRFLHEAFDQDEELSFEMPDRSVLVQRARQIVTVDANFDAGVLSRLQCFSGAHSRALQPFEPVFFGPGDRWESGTSNGASRDGVLVVFADSFGRAPIELVRNAFREYGGDRVWFLELRGRYVPYRMTPAEFEDLILQVARLDRYSFTIRVARKLLKEWRLVEYPKTREAIDQIWGIVRPIIDAAAADGAEQWQREFREYFLHYAPGTEIALGNFKQYTNLLFFLERVLGGPLTGRVLEMGCGFGIQSVLFALRSPNATVVGLDPYLCCVQSTRALSQVVPRLEAVEGTAEKTGLPDASFDLIFSSEAVQHFRHIQKSLAEAHRVLKPGGVLVIDEVNLEEINSACLDSYATPYRMAPLAEYEMLRRRFIRQQLPAASPPEVARLASKAVGLEADEIVAWLRGGADDDELARINDAKRREGEYFPQRRLDGWCEERFFSASQLEEHMRRAGFRDVRTVFHINAEIQVPRALRRFASRILVIGRRAG